MKAHFKKYTERYWLLLIFSLALLQIAHHGYLYDPRRRTLPYLLSGPLYISFIIVSIGLLLAPLSTKRLDKWTAWWIFDVSLSTFLVSQGFKLMVKLPRPAPSHSHSGFPSGHTLFAFALAWLVMRAYPKLGPFAFAFAFAVGWSRVAVNAHYPYQVFCGAAFGLLLGIGISELAKGLLLPRILRRKSAVVQGVGSRG